MPTGAYICVRENAPVVDAARDRGHGRDETRTLQVLPASPGLFPCAAQASLIERTVRDPHGGQLRSAVAALGIASRASSVAARPRSSPPRPAALGH
jgi:hypothetical protein